MDKIHKRLVGWNGSYLSKEGKLVLIKSVLASLPTYFLSLFEIPTSVEKRIECLQRDFLWRKSKDGNRLHLVSWNEVCKPKHLGGLGINRIRETNRALLSKWLWRFSQDGDSLWRQVIANKYGVVNDWETETSTRPYGCGCWRAIMKTAEDFKRGTEFEIGSGSRIRFWKDRWCSDRLLLLESPFLFNLVNNNETTVVACWVPLEARGA